MEKRTRVDALEFLDYRLVLGLLLSLVVFALAFQAGAVAQVRPADPSSPASGTLTALTPNGKPVEFPLRHTDVDIAVSGFLARATVTQTFANPSHQRIEAVYVFPLPENAAVDDMTMQVGSRTIRGLIKERQEAQRVYNEAKAQGKTASLLTQERPNIFTQAVANILPGDVIRITISYVQYLKYEKGLVSMAFPMVVGPRYIPGASYAADGSVTPIPGAEQPVKDADRITPPVMKPGTRSGHDISVTVNLGAGVPFANLLSKSHQVVITQVDPSSAIVRLDPADSIPNKDFLLEWQVDPQRVATGVLTHRSDDEGFVTLMMVPSVTPRQADVTPKEMVFVVDCSGSQMGAPIEQEKMLVRHALENLNPDDSFQILTFSTSVSGLSPLPVPNTADNRRRARAFLDALQGEGGTEMVLGIKAALDFPPDDGRLREVLFLTDGYIGNETQILDAIRARIGGARLFPLGVGSSVNRYLLENMALEGRGSVQYIRPDEDARPYVEKFYDQIRSPLLTDVEIDWGGLQVGEVLPARVPDLFAGHPLLVTGKFTRGGTATVKVRARLAGERVELPVEVTLPEKNLQNSVLRALWARQSIEGFMRQMLQGENPELVKKVIATSIRHRVLSQYTAFVAVEEKIRTNERGDPVKVEVPVELPDLVSYEGVFGGEERKEMAGKAGAMQARAAKIMAAPAPMGAVGRGMGGGGYGMGSGSVTVRGSGTVGGASYGAAARAPASAPMKQSVVGHASYSMALSTVSAAGAVAADDKADEKPAEKREKIEEKLTLQATVVSAGGSLVPSAVQSAAGTVFHVLKRCLAFAKEGGKTLPASLLVVLKTDANGKVTSAVIENPPKDLDESLRLCLERTFKGLTLGGAGEARIRLDIR